MNTNPFSIAARALVLFAILMVGLPHRSNAGDRDISPAQYNKAKTMMSAWLKLVDQGKYPESFAAAAESFRRNSSTEKWAAKHAQMLTEMGPVVSRGEIVSFVPGEKEGVPSSYFVTFKTKFKKKAGSEYVQIVNEKGEWKVASYSTSTET